jgi:hypothetical protein
MKRFAQTMIVAAVIGWGAGSRASETLPTPTGPFFSPYSVKIERTNAPVDRLPAQRLQGFAGCSGRFTLGFAAEPVAC